MPDIPIINRYSVTSGNVPVSLFTGELATNVADGKMYVGGVTSGSVTTIIDPYTINIGSGYITSGLLGDGSVVSGSIASGQVAQQHLATVSTPTSGYILTTDGNAFDWVIVPTTFSLTSGVITSGYIGDNSVNSGNISALQVGEPHIFDAAVTSGKIASGAVGEYHIYDSAITSGKIASGQVAQQHLATVSTPTSGYILTTDGNAFDWITVPSTFSLTSGVITSGYLGDNSVVSGSIASGQVGEPHIFDAAVTSGKIASGQIGEYHIYDSAITSGKIASGQIGQYHLSDNSVFSGNIASGQIGQYHLSDNSVVSGSIASGQIGQYHLSDNSVVSGSIASGQIGQYHLSDNSVTSGAVASGQIGQYHLSDNSVTSGAVASGQIGQYHLSDNSVFSGNIASGQIGQYHLSDNSVVSGSIASGQVGQYHLSDNSIFSGNIASGQIGQYHLSDNSVVSGSIASGQIGQYHLSDNSVTSGAVASGQIGQYHLSDNSVFSGNIASGQIQQPHFGTISTPISGYILQTDGTAFDWVVPPLSLTSGVITSGYVGNDSVLSGSIASGQIGQYHLSDNIIFSGAIASGQVSNFHLSSGAAIFNLQSGSINTPLLADESVRSGSIASGQVSNFHLSSGAAIFNLQSGSINTPLLADESVRSGSIASGQVSHFHLSSGAAIFNLQSGSINTPLLADESIRSGSIASGQVSHFHLSSGAAIFNLQSGSINTPLLADESVRSGSIASGQVSHFHLSSGAAIFNLQSGSIISPLIGNNSISSGQISSGSVGTYHLASTTPISGKILQLNGVQMEWNNPPALESGQVVSTNLANNSVLSGNIASGQISQPHMASGYILPYTPLRDENLFIGTNNNIDGVQGLTYGNIAIGEYAIQSGEYTNYNTAIGLRTLKQPYNINSGSLGNSTAVGAFAGEFETFGGENTYIGRGAGQYISSGRDNVAIGYRAGSTTSGNTQKSGGSNNIYIGANAGSLTGQTNYEIVIGSETNTTLAGFGSGTTTIGHPTFTKSGTIYGGIAFPQGLASGTVRSGAISSGQIGTYHLGSTTPISGKVLQLNGVQMQWNDPPSVISSGQIQLYDLANNSVLSGNLRSGIVTKAHLASGFMFGKMKGGEGFNNGSYSTFVMEYDEFPARVNVNKDGVANGGAYPVESVIIGYGAFSSGFVNSGQFSHSQDTAIGAKSMWACFLSGYTQGANVAVGYGAMKVCDTYGSVAVGWEAGSNNLISGNQYNTAIGYEAGNYINGPVLLQETYELQQYNTHIGYKSKGASGCPRTSYEIVIGAESFGLGSGSTVIGTSGRTNSCIIYGETYFPQGLTSGSITSGSLSSGIISNFKMASGAILSGHIGQGAVLAASIASGYRNFENLLSKSTIVTNNSNILHGCESWSSITLPSTRTWVDVAYGQNQYVAIDSGNNTPIYSIDGVNWFNATTTINGAKRLLYVAGDGWWNIFVTGSALSYYSIDGKTWTSNATAPNLDVILNCRSTGGTYFGGGGGGVGIVIGTTGGASRVYRSSGVDWYLVTMPANASGSVWRDAAFGNGKWIFIQDGTTNAYTVSVDGTNFTNLTFPASIQADKIIFGNGIFVVTRVNSNTHYWSADGINWNAFSTNTTDSFTPMYIGERFYLMPSTGSTQQFLNPANNYTVSSEGTLPVNGGFITIGADKAILFASGVAYFSHAQGRLTQQSQIVGQLDNFCIGQSFPQAATVTNLTATQNIFAGRYFLSSGCVISGSIASGQVGSFALGSGAIVSGRVASGQIGFRHLANEVWNNISRVNDFRIGVQSGVSVTSTDQSAQSTIFLNPHTGDNIELWNGSSWQLYSTSGTCVTLPITGLLSGRIYDIYAEPNGVNPQLSFSTVYANDNSRTDTLTYKNGAFVLSTDNTKRLIGTMRAATPTTTNDTLANRLVANFDNQVPRSLFNTETASHTYSSTTGRIWNNNSGNQIIWIQSRAGVGGSLSIWGGVARTAGTGFAILEAQTNAGAAYSAVYSQSATTEYNGGQMAHTENKLGYNYAYPQERNNVSGTLQYDVYRIHAVQMG